MRAITKRTSIALLVAALLLSTSGAGLPAPAYAQAVPHLSGYTTASMEAGGSGICNSDGSGSVSPGQSVEGYWKLWTATLVDSLHGFGSMELCGRFAGSTLNDFCDGAASLAGTRGYEGRGALTFSPVVPGVQHQTVLLDDIGWATSVGYPHTTLIHGRVVNAAGTAIGSFDAIAFLQGGCDSAYTVIMSYTVVYDVPPIDPEASPSEPCGSDDTRVTRVPGEVGDPSDPNHLAYEVDVHQTDEEVDVCVHADGGGQPFVDRYVRVPTDLGDPEPGDPPIEVDASAPPGDGAGSPCNQQVTSAGGDPHAFIRRSSSTTPAVVCVGFRNGAEESHIWITIG